MTKKIKKAEFITHKRYVEEVADWKAINKNITIICETVGPYRTRTIFGKRKETNSNILTIYYREN